MDAGIANFKTFLGRSKNGIDKWEPLVLIADSASMGRVWLSDSSDDILFAYESSPGFKGNNIVMRQYTSLDAMIANNFTDKLNITHSLGAINEGTPSFDKVDFSGKLTTSNFTLRLHFYKNSQHD
jgi:hypothetical protein